MKKNQRKLINLRYFIPITIIIIIMLVIISNKELKIVLNKLSQDINDSQIKEHVSTEFINTKSLTPEQKAIQEVANAYYNKGVNAQYCSFRKTYVDSPEEATSQHTIYSVCSDFTYLVYKNAFEINVQNGYLSTHEIIAYADKYYDPDNIKTNDVVEYWKKTTDENNNRKYIDNKGNTKDIDLSTDEGRKNYASKILIDYNLQVGDILCYHTGNEGHALLVYKIIYDENGNSVDAIIRESTSKFEKKTTKITQGLSYSDILNENNNVREGTFRELYLSGVYNTSSSITRKPMLYNARNMSYFTILRPLLKDENGNYTGKYYHATFKAKTGALPTGYVCNDRTLTDYKMKNSAKSRIKYNAIDIEKIVDVFNNSIVSLGDTLEYTIRVTNNSDTNYSSFHVIENYSDYVELLDSSNGVTDGNKIIWNIPSLASKKSIEIKYKVKVKNNISFLGKKIISTGTVADIPSSTIKNTISCNLKENEKLAIKNKMQTMLKTKQYRGQQLISKIYNESFGINLNIENFDISDLVKVKNGTTFYPQNSSKSSTIYINNENNFYNMLLSNYYGALYTNNSGRVYIKRWESPANEIISGRSERADTIYKEHFQTGDVLVYKNTQTANADVTYKTENGTYYLIYISEDDKITFDGENIYGFIGLDEEGNLNKISTDNISMQTLLGKDYYAVLRPSMAIDLVAMDLDVGYSTSNITNQGITITITSNEKMLEVKGWNLSKDGLTLTKTYSANTTEEIEIYDYFGNKITKKIEIKNIDVEVPTVKVDYSTTKQTNGSVTATITANEKVKQIEGWTIDNTKKILTKTFTKNCNETVVITDLAGNTKNVDVKITNIVKTKIEANVEYSTTLLTNKDVTVTVNLNKKIKSVKGWNLSKDGKKLTKVFSSNAEKEIEVQDSDGNTKKVKISVINIDKIAPKVDVNYNTASTANKDVLVTLKANEEIQEIKGWTLSKDGKVLTKTYTLNNEEIITIKDLAGNKVDVNVKINNIDEKTPNENVDYNEKEIIEEKDSLSKAKDNKFIIFVVAIILILLVGIFCIKIKKHKQSK